MNTVSILTYSTIENPHNESFIDVYADVQNAIDHATEQLKNNREDTDHVLHGDIIIERIEDIKNIKILLVEVQQLQHGKARHEFEWFTIHTREVK